MGGAFEVWHIVEAQGWGKEDGRHSAGVRKGLWSRMRQRQAQPQRRAISEMSLRSLGVLIN